MGFLCRYAPFYYIVGFVYWLQRVWLQDLGFNLVKGKIRRPCIVVSNHPTDTDPLFISLCLSLALRFRPIHWLAKHELLNETWLRSYYIPTFPRWIAVPLARFAVMVIKGFGAIPVDREHPASTENRNARSFAEEVLRHGGVIGVFSEGGTSAVFKKRGGGLSVTAVRLASITGVPIVPVSVTDSGKVIVGKPIQIGPGVGPETRRELTKIIMQEIWQLASAA